MESDRCFMLSMTGGCVCARIPDSRTVGCPCFPRTCTEEFRAPPLSRRIRSGTWDFLERRRANNPAEDCSPITSSTVVSHRSKRTQLRSNAQAAHLGIAQMATNKFQLWKRNQPCRISTSNGIISHAIAIHSRNNRTIIISHVQALSAGSLDSGKLRNLLGNAIMPTVQNSSIQHRIFSLYLVGWNSPKYGKHMPIAPATLQFIGSKLVFIDVLIGMAIPIEFLRITRIHWRIGKTWINCNIELLMIEGHRIHPVIGLRPTQPFCPSCPLSSPKSMSRTAFLRAHKDAHNRHTKRNADYSADSAINWPLFGRIWIEFFGFCTLIFFLYSTCIRTKHWRCRQ